MSNPWDKWHYCGSKEEEEWCRSRQCHYWIEGMEMPCLYPVDEHNHGFASTHDLCSACKESPCKGKYVECGKLGKRHELQVP